MTATQTETANTLQEAIAGEKPTLVEFYATWCPHCQRMMPIMDELRSKIGTQASIVQIDAEANPELAQKYHIHSYPTWIIFRDGQEAWRDGGEKPLWELDDMLHRFM